MAFLEVLLVVVLLFGVAAVATGRGGSMADAPADGWAPKLQERVEAEDIAQVRFALAFRGYRMAQVDAVLDRLAGEIIRRDTELAQLHAELERLVEQPVELSTAWAAPVEPAFEPTTFESTFEPTMDQLAAPDAGSHTDVRPRLAPDSRPRPLHRRTGDASPAE